MVREESRKLRRKGGRKVNKMSHWSTTTYSIKFRKVQANCGAIDDSHHLPPNKSESGSRTNRIRSRKKQEI